MLSLSRKTSQAILIGDNIRIVITSYDSKHGVRLGIEAPKGVLILREELLYRTHDETEK